jgi:hypothetical protein
MRSTTPHEEALLRVMLQADFPGGPALLEQLAVTRVTPMDDDGSLQLPVGDAPRAKVVRRVPVEAETKDDDGVTIHLLIHVAAGPLNELEIYREDSAAVLRHIDPAALRVCVL